MKPATGGLTFGADHKHGKGNGIVIVRSPRVSILTAFGSCFAAFVHGSELCEAKWVNHAVSGMGSPVEA